MSAKYQKRGGTCIALRKAGNLLRWANTVRHRRVDGKSHYYTRVTQPAAIDYFDCGTCTMSYRLEGKYLDQLENSALCFIASVYRLPLQLLVMT